MDYSVLVDTYEKLEATSSKLGKTDIIADLLSKTPTEDIPEIILLLQGRVFPKLSGYELGIATQMMIRAVSKATGFLPKDVEKKFKETGDLGLAAEHFVKSKRQVTLLKKKLTVEIVFNNLKKLALITGVGSQEKKLSIIAELLVSAKPKEARYIVRTILGELRVGVAEGILRDAIVKAFLVKKEASKEEIKKATEAVEYAWNILCDFGEVAEIAKEKGIKGVKNVKVQVGRPVQVMLGLSAKSIRDVVDGFGKVVAEYKYDGLRVQCHKKGNLIKIFTRRLEDVTNQFPDLVDLCRRGLKADECIVEGEAIGINPKTKLPLPFQVLSKRIHRKYEIHKMVKEIPIQVHLFDIIHLEGKMLFDKPLLERRKILEKIVKPIPGKFELAKKIFSSNIEELEKFYKEALEARQEGLFLKVPDSKYVFGRHVGGWYKIKPIMETLDLVIVGATWGSGARAKWLSSFILACRDPDTGNFLPCGMMGTGLTEQQFQMMTETLKSLITREKGRKATIKPEIVVEVGYQEIQKSPNYKSGFALRFPRLIRIRDDKSPEEADTIQRVRELYKSQGRVG